MNDSQERYRKRERHERWKITAVAVISFAVVVLLGIGVATLIGVSDQTSATTSISRSNHAQLVQLQQLARSIHRQQLADNGDRQQLAADITQVSNYATSLANEITANHAAGVKNDATICASLNAITDSLGIHTACSVSAST